MLSNMLLQVESMHYKKISFTIHLLFIAYILYLAYNKQDTPRHVLIFIGGFVILYGISIMLVGIHYR